ncbi:MAG: hypothetical protein ABIN91_06745 [Mucilaginibacter sp.]|uniref:hypothetical protein n=1 Tax=Mucilaginibacter sp. TaxID=1882438 RepID=UPI003262F169
MKTNTVTKLPKMAFGLGFGLLLAIVTMSSFKAGHKEVDSYRYNQTTQQDWDSDIDQASSHYSLVSGSYSCGSSSKICTYTLVDGVFTQDAEGSYTP